MIRQSEAIVLRTYPLREADLLVTLFTRTEGKLKGVARSAKRSRRRFGAALEPLTCVRVYWEDREKRDLARLDACEVIQSPLSSPVDYPRAVALAHMAELLDELLPEREANDAVFRLAVSVLGALRDTASVSGGRAAAPGRSASIWLPLTYFDLWLLRLVGFLPELFQCATCGAALNGGKAFYHALADGVMCETHRRLASSELSEASRAVAGQMFRAPLESLADQNWPRDYAADLRRLLLQIMERHLEKKLVTARMLEKL